jgi:hypothetical protein
VENENANEVVKIKLPKARINKNAQRLYSKMGSHCSNAQFYEEFKKVYPEDYQEIVSLYERHNTSVNKLDRCVKEYIFNLINRVRESARKFKIEDTISKRAKAKHQPELDAIKKCKTVEELKPYLSSNTIRIRRDAAYALRNPKFDMKEAKAALLPLTRGGAHKVRAYALESLAIVNKRIDACKPHLDLDAAGINKSKSIEAV